MNIALVSMTASPFDCPSDEEGSGQSVLIDGLSRALARLGHLATIYVRRNDPSLPAQISSIGDVRTVYLDAGPLEPTPAGRLGAHIAEFSARLADAWRREPPDVIHAFTWMSGKAAVAAAAAEALPVVQTFASLTPRERRRDGLGNEEAALMRAAARIVATSSAQVFSLLGLGANPAAITFVPCGVDLEAFVPVARAERRRDSRFFIATLSALGERDGIDDVIESLAFVDSVELVVGGGRYAGADIFNDPNAERLHALAAARGVADRVHFAGRVPRGEVAAFMRSADVVVCPPHGDSRGTAALEAMACGLPVIVSAVGGLVDAVADGMTGIHVPPHAPRQLAYAVASLRTDAALRERFGRFGAERTKARYGWPRIAAQTVDIYRNVAARSAGFAQSRAFDGVRNCS